LPPPAEMAATTAPDEPAPEPLDERASLLPNELSSGVGAPSEDASPTPGDPDPELLADDPDPELLEDDELAPSLVDEPPGPPSESLGLAPHPTKSANEDQTLSAKRVLGPMACLHRRRKPGVDDPRLPHL
jgi:hypothetical protein